MSDPDTLYDEEGLAIGDAYEEPRRGISAVAKLLIAVGVVVGGVAFATIIWIAYDTGARSGAGSTVPVLHADSGDIKRKPEDPGGLEIPHQDKLVFNRLAPGQSAEPVERLLPPPEKPLPLPLKSASESPVLAVKPAADEAATPTAATPDPERAPPPKPTPPIEHFAAAAPAKLPPAPSPAPPPVAETQSAAATPPPPVAKPTPEPSASVGWRIQLAALRSRADAKAAWSRLRKANPDLLDGLELRVQTAKLSRGTFYRVQAGLLADRAAAQALCAALKSRKQDCLVVAP